MLKIAHSVVAGGVNDPSRPVSKDAWNADHQISGAAGTLFAFGAGGAAVELNVGAGLAIVGGDLVAEVSQAELDGKAAAVHDHVIADVSGLQGALDAKAPLASPALTGAPTAPTPATADASTKIATTAFVDARLAALIGMAPAELDTLVEIAARIEAEAGEQDALTAVVAGKAAKAANLGDLTDMVAARANLGLGSAALAAAGDFAAAVHGHDVVVAAGAAGFMSGADKAKLDGVQAGATANATDAQLRDRATHTGTQAAATISDLAEAVRDTMGLALVAGANVAITVNDAGDTIEIAASGGGAAAPENRYVAGRWFPTLKGSAAAGSAPGDSWIRLYPFRLEQTATVSELGVRVTTAATGSFRLAIYGSDADGAPTGLPVVTTGDLTTGATGTVSADVADVQLEAGRRYWAALICSSSTAAFQAVSSGENAVTWEFGAATLAAASPGASDARITYHRSHTYADPFPNLTGLALSSGAANQFALLYIRIGSLP